MAVEDIIQLGDKVDISFVQQIENMNSSGKSPKVYKSQVLDFGDNGNLVLSMPCEGSRLILMPLGVRLEFIFFTHNGMYRAMGQIKERYKSRNIYMIEIEMKTRLEKYQRREYFRYPFLLDFNYYIISEEESKYESGNALYIHLRELDVNQYRERLGSVVDLSGGGIRFRTDVELKPEQWVLFSIHLQNENLNKQYYIVGSVISCIQASKTAEKPFEVRAKFQIQEASTREEIIRFIFEEERKSRQRGRW